MNGFYKFAMLVMRVVMPLWYKIDAEGTEYLPDEGGYLFVSNHRSNADPILIGIQNRDTQFCFLAKQELFSSGLVGWLLRKLGGVAVDRGAGDVTALEEIAFRLQNGENALIFPEGTRSKDGKLGHFKTGAALIAAQTGVPVVPVAISFEGKLHFRSHISVRYGAPFDIPETDPHDPSPAVLKQIRRAMTDSVSGLLEMKDQEDVPQQKALPLRTERNPEIRKAETNTNETRESEDTENKMSRNRHSNHPGSGEPENTRKNRGGAPEAEDTRRKNQPVPDDADEFDFIFDDFDEDDETAAPAGETAEAAEDDAAIAENADDAADEEYDTDADFLDGEEDAQEEYSEILDEEDASAEEEISDGDDFTDDEEFADGEAYPEDDYAEDEYSEDDDSEDEFDEEEYPEDEYSEEDYAEEEYSEEEFDDADESAEEPKKTSIFSKIAAPFKKLFASLNAEPDMPDFDEDDDADDEDSEDDAPAVKRRKPEKVRAVQDDYDDGDGRDAEEALPEDDAEDDLFADDDDAFADDGDDFTEESAEDEPAEEPSDDVYDDPFDADEPEAAAEESEDDTRDYVPAAADRKELSRRKQRTQVWNSEDVKKAEAAGYQEPVYDEPDIFGGDASYDEEESYDEPDYQDEYDDGYDDTDEAENSRRGLSGISLRKPFRRRTAVRDLDDDFYDEDEEESGENVDDAYDDGDSDEDAGGMFGGKIDYGKIALILTFVILGIFAIDFVRRLWGSWSEDKNRLNIQSGVSSEVESMTPDVTGIAEVTSTSAVIETTTTTLSTEIFTSPYESTSDANDPGADVENRESETTAVANAEMHRGSAILINADHQQTATPNLVTIGSIGLQHVRMVNTELQIDSSMSQDLVRWFSDFYAATGLGNVMIYSTTQQPAAAVSAQVPYGIAIPERTAGLSLDLAILDETNKTHTPYSASGNYAWLAEHAHEYGFIVRYPDDKTESTGMEGNTWHFRYVGVPHAAYIKENKLSLEEYLTKLSGRTWEKEHLTVTVGGVNYEMYYAPASQLDATTEIKFPVGAQPVVSGDNINGFVISCVKQ